MNAVGEEVFTKASYKKSILSQRCLIPVMGFYEWRDIKKIKYPYHISLVGDDVFCFGGIYDHWVDRSTGEIKKTFSIITTAANPMMEKIHNLKKRMPLIISTEDQKRWIDPGLPVEDIKGLIKPYDENQMRAYTISRDANNARNERNVPEILIEVIFPELEKIGEL